MRLFDAVKVLLLFRVFLKRLKEVPGTISN